MNYLKKLLFIIALSFSVIIFREFIALYNDLNSIDPYLGYAFLLCLILVLIYFVAAPLAKIMLIPSIEPPAKNETDERKLISNRLKKLKKNILLKEFDFDSYQNETECYNAAIEVLKKEAESKRRNYTKNVIASTAVSQNGFIDAIIMLSACINLIKDIFTIYNGKLNLKDMVKIFSKIYTAIAISGSDITEKSIEELISGFASDGIKSIPFIDKIASSLIDGIINAILITRISMIAENYCTMTLVKDDKELNPKLKEVGSFVFSCGNDYLKLLSEQLKKTGKIKFSESINKVTYSISNLKEGVKENLLNLQRNKSFKAMFFGNKDN